MPVSSGSEELIDAVAEDDKNHSLKRSMLPPPSVLGRQLGSTLVVPKQAAAEIPSMEKDGSSSSSHGSSSASSSSESGSHSSSSSSVGSDDDAARMLGMEVDEKRHNKDGRDLMTISDNGGKGRNSESASLVRESEPAAANSSDDSEDGDMDINVDLMK